MEITPITTTNHCNQWVMPLYTIYIFQHPTWNCQLFTVGPLENIFKHKDIDAIDILKTIAETIAKPRMLVDIKSTYVTKFESLFEPDKIIVKSPYVSSNNSSMVLYQVDVRHLYKT